MACEVDGVSGAGLGKTTLAHVVARHCGYQPREINASDDRTANTLVARVQDAAQMQSVLGARRPNCVIIDEIDGSAGALPACGLLAVWQLRPAGNRLPASQTTEIVFPCGPRRLLRCCTAHPVGSGPADHGPWGECGCSALQKLSALPQVAARRRTPSRH